MGVGKRKSLALTGDRTFQPVAGRCTADALPRRPSIKMKSQLKLRWRVVVRTNVTRVHTDTHISFGGYVQENQDERPCLSPNWGRGRTKMTSEIWSY
jgi:hypothetical protein